MKTLILMRHGKAEPYAATDAQRPLIQAGREKVADSACAIKAAGYKPGLLLSSPLLRAMQSAQIAGDILGLAPQKADELDGRLSAKGLLEYALALLERADCVMLVGHNPNISLAAGMLRQQYTPFEAGAFAVFDLTDPALPKVLTIGD